MPLQPLEDAFDVARRTVTGNPPKIPPAASGDGTRQNRIPPNRIGVPVRNLIRWFIPETGIVDMYINPENISYQDKKVITNTRTKGGYVLQYWGEDLTRLDIRGTTGSSGVEGINVLFDIYRGEQLAFDPFALALAAQADAENANLNLLGDLEDTFFDQVNNALETGSVTATRPAPTLASLAFSVEMYWSGWTYRGYFENFSLTESVTKLGLFDYNMTFVATQRRGFRSNFFGWHRSPVHGPSDSDPNVGVPHSYAGTAAEQATTAGRQGQERLINTLFGSRGYAGQSEGFLSSLF